MELAHADVQLNNQQAFVCKFRFRFTAFRGSMQLI